MFTSTTALRKYVATVASIPADSMEFIELSSGEKMLVMKGDHTKPLGFATFTYRGMVPGRGKVWDIYARPAEGFENASIV